MQSVDEFVRQHRQSRFARALPIVGVGFQLHYSSDRFRESGRFQPKSLGLGGWTPTNVHYYSVSEGALYMGDGGFKRVQVPGGSSGAMVPSTDASEMYIFDANGRHIQTLDSVTGLLIARMTYASDGRLTSISDRFNNVVTMVPHSGGITLTSPYGQATVLSFDSDGLLASVENPNGEKHQITYDQRGFLTSFQLPMGQTSSVSYDDYGHVTEDLGAGGDRLTLGRTFDSATRFRGEHVSNRFLTTPLPTFLRSLILWDVKHASSMTKPDGLRKRCFLMVAA